MNNINTIFYYAESLSFSDYITMLQSGEITYRTIVFAQAQKAIYKGGVQYGATDLADLKEQLKTLLDGQEVIQKIENIVNNHFDLDPQDLPTASTTKKGCIKVGAGLSMSGDTMSVDLSNVPGGANGINGIDGIVEQIIKNQASVRASKNNYGVVRVGDGIDVTNGIISVSLTQGPKGDKGDTGAQGPQGERGPAGPAYDDSALQRQIAALDDAIDAVNDTANGEKARLDSLIEDLDGEISERVDAMFEDAQWVQEHVANQIVSESNFGEDDVEAYLQRIGVWEENEDHTASTTKWSKISQTVTTLEHAVGQLVDDGVDQQWLQSQIQQKIEDGIASLDLSTLYARKQAETVIEWLYSGLRGRTNDTTTFADIVSAGKNSLHQAIADIHTYVEKLKSGDYVATASLEASVDSAIAGLKASASSNTAKTEIFNKISQNSTDIAAIVSSITNDNSSTTIANKIGNWRSGLITSANLDSAIASLLSTNGTYTAGIMTEAEFNSAKTQLVAKSDYDAATIVAMINNAGSLVEISADKIDLDGETIFDLLSSVSKTNPSYGQAAIEMDCDSIEMTYTVGSSVHDRMVITPRSMGVWDNYNDGQTYFSGGNLDVWNSNTGTLISASRSSQVVELGPTRVLYQANKPAGSYFIVEPDASFYESISIGPVNNDTTMYHNNSGKLYISTGISVDGDIEVSSGNNVTAPGLTATSSITVGSGGDSYTFSYNSGDSVADLSSGLEVGGDLYTGGSVYVTGTVHQNSDERIKTNITPVSVDIEDIAEARIVDFNFKGKEETHFGSIAQDWQNIFSNAVEEDKDGILSMNYGAIALGSAVTAAREIVELKKKNAELEARLAALEAKLG